MYQSFLNTKVVPYKDSVRATFMTPQISRRYSISVHIRTNIPFVTAANSFLIHSCSSTTSRDNDRAKSFVFDTASQKEFTGRHVRKPRRLFQKCFIITTSSTCPMLWKILIQIPSHVIMEMRKNLLENEFLGILFKLWHQPIKIWAISYILFEKKSGPSSFLLHLAASLA